MDWLKSLYPEVYNVLQNAAPDFWPELKTAFGTLFQEPFLPVAILPLAACRAVQGQARAAVPVAAALVAASTSVRIIDDMADRDRPGQLWQKIGPDRALNYAVAVLLLSFDILNKAPFSAELSRKINQLYLDTFFHLAAGQDKDLGGVTRTVEDYWSTIEQKSAAPYAAACASGAMAGTDDPELVDACYTFGQHVGLAIQIFNDMESIWQPEGVPDLRQGKVTLPLLYGLQSNHPDRAELVFLVESNQFVAQAGRVKEILDKIDTKAFLIWAALKEREQALEAISICPNGEGREALESFITGMFGDIDQLLHENQVEVDLFHPPPRTGFFGVWFNPGMGKG